MTHNYTAIKLIPVEPINDVHTLLIIGAFNRFFVKDGGPADGNGDGYGYGDGNGYGYGDGNGCGGYGNGTGCGGYGDGYGYGYGTGDGDDKVGGIPKEWRV